MCLDKVSKKKPAPEGIGYKVFHLWPGDDQLYGDIARRNKVRPVGTWLKSRNYSVPRGDVSVISIRGKYPVGWHIFKSLAGARDWVYGIDPDSYATRRIKYRQAHTEGTNDNYKIVIAKEIYIIP